MWTTLYSHVVAVVGVACPSPEFSKVGSLLKMVVDRLRW